MPQQRKEDKARRKASKKESRKESKKKRSHKESKARGGDKEGKDGDAKRSKKRRRSASPSSSASASSSSSSSASDGPAASADAPPGPHFPVVPISEENDYFIKNHEFASWLKATRGVFFTQLLAADARAAFREFAAEWNARRLPRRLYEGVQVTGRR